MVCFSRPGTLSSGVRKLNTWHPMSTFGNGTSQQKSGPTTILQKSHGHASASRGRLAARTCVSFARAASDSLMSYRVSCFSDPILDLSHHVSYFRVGEVRLTLQVSILFCFICQTFKLLQNFILGGSKWRQSGSHMQGQSKNLVPARSRLLEHSVWIKLTM